MIGTYVLVQGSSKNLVSAGYYMSTEKLLTEHVSNRRSDNYGQSACIYCILHIDVFKEYVLPGTHLYRMLVTSEDYILDHVDFVNDIINSILKIKV